MNNELDQDNSLGNRPTEWKPTLKEACRRGGATCVQTFDDSLNPAIHITYRISLRSSSLWEPRYPLLGLMIVNFVYNQMFDK